LAEVIERFTEIIGLVRFSIYVFDYGAPTGFDWPFVIPSASPQSSRRTETPTRRD